MISINDNIQRRAPKGLDDWSGVWDSGVWRAYNNTSEALSRIPVAFRNVGQTVLINMSGLNTEYWFRDDVNTLIPKSVDLSDYYTKSELQTSGQAQVHWDNITNVPAATIPTLQQVTDAGNITTNNLTVESPGGFATSLAPERLIFHHSLSNPNTDSWIRLVAGNISRLILPITAQTERYMPLSVNGVYANDEGNINIGSFLPLSGGTMSGGIGMAGSKITGLGYPTNPSDAASKEYVDDVIDNIPGGFNVANSSGTNQFGVSPGGQLRFIGAGGTSVSFNSSNNSVTITGGGGGGGGDQTLSLDGTAGGISISDGNTINLPSLTRPTFGTGFNFTDWAINNDPGFYPLNGTTGSIGLPTATSNGFLSRRSASGNTLNGSFGLFAANNGSHEIYMATGNGTQFNPYTIIADRDWTSSNFVDLSSNQNNIGGDKSYTGRPYWSTSSTALPGSNRITIGQGQSGGTTGQYMVGSNAGGNDTTFNLRTYSANGIQLTLSAGGINTPVTSSIANGPYFAGGNVVLGVNSSGSTVVSGNGNYVYLRPTGVSSSENELRISASGEVVVRGLSGTGTQMVVANSAGTLSRQAIPAVGVTQVNSGTHLTGGPIMSTGTLSLQPQINTYIDDSQGNPRIYLGNSGSNGFIFRLSPNGGTAFQFRDSDNTTVWQINQTGGLAIGTVPWARLSGYPYINPGNGLTGGGELSGTRTLTVGAGTGITVNTTTVALTSITAGSTTVGALRYAGTTRTSGQLYGGTTVPNSSTRLNYNGILHAYDFIAYGSSDRKLKENIAPIVNPLEKLSQIGGYSFKWKDGHDSYQGNDYGVIAQEVKRVLPDMVFKREDGLLGIKRQEQLTALLIEAIKELKKEVEALKNGVA